VNEQPDNPVRMVSLPDRLALRPKEAAETLGLSERALRSLLPRLTHVRAGVVVHGTGCG
jgi:hypothetical protein